MFNEANTVEDFIRNLLSGSSARTLRDLRASYGRAPHDSAQMAQALTGVGWQYIPSEQLPRANEVICKPRAMPLLAVAKEDL